MRYHCFELGFETAATSSKDTAIEKKIHIHFELKIINYVRYSGISFSSKNS